jgi:hypothetical protein
LIDFGLLVLKKIFFKKNLLFPYYLPLEKGYPLPLNKLESPLPKDSVPSLIEFGLLILEKIF